MSTGPLTAPRSTPPRKTGPLPPRKTGPLPPRNGEMWHGCVECYRRGATAAFRAAFKAGASREVLAAINAIIEAGPPEAGQG